MCKAIETILIYAENLRAEFLYDLKFNLSAVKFYRAKFDNDRASERKLCKILYK